MKNRKYSIQEGFDSPISTDVFWSPEYFGRFEKACEKVLKVAGKAGEPALEALGTLIGQQDNKEPFSQAVRIVEFIAKNTNGVAVQSAYDEIQYLASSGHSKIELLDEKTLKSFCSIAKDFKRHRDGLLEWSWAADSFWRIAREGKAKWYIDIVSTIVKAENSMNVRMATNAMHAIFKKINPKDEMQLSSAAKIIETGMRIKDTAGQQDYFENVEKIFLYSQNAQKMLGLTADLLETKNPAVGISRMRIYIGLSKMFLPEKSEPDYGALSAYVAEGRLNFKEVARLQNPDYEFFAKNYEGYKALIKKAIQVGGISETAIVDAIDFKKVYSTPKTLEDYYKTYIQLSQLSAPLGKKMLAESPPPFKWFPQQTFSKLDEMPPLNEMGAALLLLQKLANSDVKWKGFFEAHKSSMATYLSKQDYVNSMPQVKTIGELETLYSSLGPIQEVLGKKGIASMLMRTVDFDSVFDNLITGRFSIREIEQARMKFNSFSSVLGDEFLYMLGSHLVQDPITPGNIEKRIQIAESFLSNPSQYEDVNPLYTLLGRFQINKIAGALQNDSELSKKWNETFEEAFDIDLKKDSALSKAFTRLAVYGFSGVVKKAYAKVAPTPCVRKEYAYAELEMRPGNEMSPGIAADLWYSKKEKVASVIKIIDSSKAGVGYVARSGGLSESQIDKLLESPKVAALAVASYTTGERKIAELAAVNGDLVSYLISSERDGLVIISKDGKAGIKKASDLKENEIETPKYKMSERRMDVRGNSDDFLLLVSKIKKSESSIFMGHLLLSDGNYEVSLENSNATQDKRRAFAIFEDGSPAIIDFDTEVTLAEMAVLGKKMGVKSMVNLDTGMYDYSMYKDAKGKIHPLGTQDIKATTNVVVLQTK